MVLPAVTVGAFEAGDGSRATFVVNTTDAAQQAALVLPQGARVTVYQADRTGAREVLSAGRVPLSLEPLGVRVVVAK